MSQEIDLGGVEVTAVDWEATLESLEEARLAELLGIRLLPVTS